VTKEDKTRSPRGGRSREGEAFVSQQLMIFTGALDRSVRQRKRMRDCGHEGRALGR
jgi:hypothetical protein